MLGGSACLQNSRLVTGLLWDWLLAGSVDQPGVLTTSSSAGLQVALDAADARGPDTLPALHLHCKQGWSCLHTPAVWQTIMRRMTEGRTRSDGPQGSRHRQPGLSRAAAMLHGRLHAPGLEGPAGGTGVQQAALGGVGVHALLVNGHGRWVWQLRCRRQLSRQPAGAVLLVACSCKKGFIAGR